MANVILGKNVNFKKVLQNRKEFLSKINVDINSCVCMWVLGEDGIKEVDKKDVGYSVKDYKKAVKVDALITDRKNLYILLLTADCAPVILYDPVQKAVGVVHAGWRGADKEIVMKAIKNLSDLYGSKPEDLIVGIGPSARKDTFIKNNPKQLKDPKWKEFIKKVSGDDYKVDFVGLCKKQLNDAGVLSKNIFDCEVDTIKNKHFFSHYREKDGDINMQGRFACVVGLK